MEKTVPTKAAAVSAQAPGTNPATAPTNPAPEANKVKYIVRISNTDLDGQKCAIIGLQKIKGVGHTFANAVCVFAGVEKNAQIGALSEAQCKKMEEIILNPIKLMPTWMLNRQFDYETGENKHLLSGDLTYQVENDVKRLKMIKTRRGLRHMWGLPLRGQKTRSEHRRTKSKKSASSKRRPHASAGAGSSESSGSKSQSK